MAREEMAREAKEADLLGERRGEEHPGIVGETPPQGGDLRHPKPGPPLQLPLAKNAGSRRGGESEDQRGMVPRQEKEHAEESEARLCALGEPSEEIHRPIGSPFS